MKKIFLLTVLFLLSTIKAQDVEVPAEFPGGIQNFRTLVSNDMDSERSSDDFGSATVAFVVERDGSVSITRITGVKSIGIALAKSILKVSAENKWKPSTFKGQFVRFFLNFPITLHDDDGSIPQSKTVARKYNPNISNYELDNPIFYYPTNQFKIKNLYQTEKYTYICFSASKGSRVWQKQENLLYIYDPVEKKKYYAKDFNSIPIETPLNEGVNYLGYVEFVIGFEKIPDTLLKFEILEGDNAKDPTANKWYVRNVDFSFSDRFTNENYVIDFDKIAQRIIRGSHYDDPPVNLGTWYTKDIVGNFRFIIYNGDRQYSEDDNKGGFYKFIPTIGNWIDVMEKNSIFVKFEKDKTIIRLKLSSKDSKNYTLYPPMDYRNWKIKISDDYSKIDYGSAFLATIGGESFGKSISANGQYLDLYFSPVKIPEFTSFSLFIGDDVKDYDHSLLVVKNFIELPNSETVFKDLNEDFNENEFNSVAKIYKYVNKHDLGNGYLISGYLKNNKLEGYGKWEKTNGEWYEGEFKNGLENGKGVYRNEKGLRYGGNFANGKPNGKFNIEQWTLAGLFTDRWEADFQNGKLISSVQTSSDMTDFLYSKPSIIGDSDGSCDVKRLQSNDGSDKNKIVYAKYSVDNSTTVTLKWKINNDHYIISGDLQGMYYYKTKKVYTTSTLGDSEIGKAENLSDAMIILIKNTHCKR